MTTVDELYTDEVKASCHSYQGKSFTDQHLAVIGQALQITNEYLAAGFTLTLRQLYYQFVARGMIANRQNEYKRLGQILSAARLAGYFPWAAIEDRTRNLESRAEWDDPAHILAQAQEQYHIDLWAGQERRPEVWIEKEALIGVVVNVCERNDVDYFACRGYTSQSEQWRAGKRLSSYFDRGQTPVVLHLGDHDPSGLDMTRDNLERLAMFCGQFVELRRLALNIDQVEHFAPPPNPTKLTDSRSSGYIRDYGHECWELDALPPDVIDELIDTAIADCRDPDIWEERVARQEQERRQLQDFIAELDSDGDGS